MYGGFEKIRSNFPLNPFVQLETKNFACFSTFKFLVFFFATITVLKSISTPMPFEEGISFNNDNKMHPLPTPSSRILISFFIKIFANSIPLETKTSLSGLGSSVESFMQNSEFQKFLFLIILLTGFPLALSFITEKNSSCFLFEGALFYLF